ncbi:Tn3 family transposase [Streptomyces sp. NPDC059443]|uniref:Tn3 family transposase n=1 Tax=unclassified Streptomyces TaxID=2593676 RepID=UPI003678514A
MKRVHNSGLAWPGLARDPDGFLCDPGVRDFRQAFAAGDGTLESGTAAAVRSANLDLIADHWDDLLRLAGSLKYGHATASLIVGKLSASSRQNALAAALKEYGAIRRTIYAAKYLSDEGYRRKIARQLNKGEALHALRRQLHYAREGKITRRQPEQQNEHAWCLTVVTNAVVCWHTEYVGLAVDELREAGREVGAEVLAHISPARSSVVNYHGSITVDYEHEPAQLDERGPNAPRKAAS